ncbi:protein FAM173B [Lingula anatina]|uniref:Protein FAM173B n=1 Tax=Lingula anatina TaxID=7574 RepID=A0A1S3ITN7_LINAN|nr:protein FAM173B [Lingula anatina]|eukprot:XP_013401570.1 protein FAM173B [Lingula anatina]
MGLQEENVEKKVPKTTRRGAVILGIFGGTFAAVYAVTVPFFLPALRKICLPYVPATDQQITNVMRMLKGRSGSLIDLGSGDGRIVLEAAKKGFKSSGVELNPWLVWFSRIQARRHGVHTQTTFFRKDLFKVNLSEYQNIVVFGVDSLMPPLEEKLYRELGDDGQVIVCRFPLTNSTPVDEVGSGVDTVWLYDKQSLFSTSEKDRKQ